MSAAVSSGSPRVAELPQFLRRSRVLEEHVVGLEGIQFAAAELVDCVGDTREQASQLRLA
jgi:hypothetical protein